MKILVEDIMTRTPWSCSPQTNLAEVAELRRSLEPVTLIGFVVKLPPLASACIEAKPCLRTVRRRMR